MDYLFTQGILNCCFIKKKASDFQYCLWFTAIQAAIKGVGVGRKEESGTRSWA